IEGRVVVPDAPTAGSARHQALPSLVLLRMRWSFGSTLARPMTDRRILQPDRRVHFNEDGTEELINPHPSEDVQQVLRFFENSVSGFGCLHLLHVFRRDGRTD